MVVFVKTLFDDLGRKVKALFDYSLDIEIYFILCSNFLSLR